LALPPGALSRQEHVGGCLGGGEERFGAQRAGIALSVLPDPVRLESAVVPPIDVVVVDRDGRWRLLTSGEEDWLALAAVARASQAVVTARAAVVWVRRQVRRTAAVDAVVGCLLDGRFAGDAIGTSVDEHGAVVAGGDLAKLVPEELVAGRDRDFDDEESTERARTTDHVAAAG
jgi:hypothetical protein